MTEIVVEISPLGILHIEVLITFWHRMNLRDMGNYMDTFCHLAGLVYQDKSVIVYFWPLRSNAVQIPSFGKELTAHGFGRDDDFSLSIMLYYVS